ncbi:MAG TPA: hypothetical protein VFD20_05905, partial [Demequina sp.]|nr:hypothetical protein [Demequina sp.]
MIVNSALSAILVAVTLVGGNLLSMGDGIGGETGYDKVSVFGSDEAASQGAPTSSGGGQDRWTRHEICEGMQFTS